MRLYNRIATNNGLNGTKKFNIRKQYGSHVDLIIILKI